MLILERHWRKKSFPDIKWVWCGSNSSLVWQQFDRPARPALCRRAAGSLPFSWMIFVNGSEDRNVRRSFHIISFCCKSMQYLITVALSCNIMQQNATSGKSWWDGWSYASFCWFHLLRPQAVESAGGFPTSSGHSTSGTESPGLLSEAGPVWSSDFSCSRTWGNNAQWPEEVKVEVFQGCSWEDVDHEAS